MTKRRELLKFGAALGATSAIPFAHANRHPSVRPTSLPYLDRNMYRRNTDVLAHFDPGEERGSKMQMMSIGPRRILFNRRDVIDVTEPLKPTLVTKGAYQTGQIQLAYNRRIGKWILMTGHGSIGTFSTPKWPHGKYDNPDLIKRNRKDFEEVPEEARGKLEFVWLETVDDAIAAGLEEEALASEAIA